MFKRLYFNGILLFIFLCLPVMAVWAKTKIIVEVLQPEALPYHQILTVSGTFTPEKRSKLSSTLAGLVSQVYVDAGSYVSKGQSLIQLDTGIGQLRLKEIQADSVKVKADYDEAIRLVEEARVLLQRKHIPATELAIRTANLALKKAELTTVEARLATQRALLERHTVKAPFSGVISKKITEQGEWVTPGDVMLELVSLGDSRLDVYLPQERFADVTINTPVVVIADAHPEQRLLGKITAIVPVSEQAVRAFLVRITLENYPYALLPGSSAKAEFSLKLNSDSSTGLMIPRDALLKNPDNQFSVFVIEDNKAYRRQVTVGEITAEGAIILKGLDYDDQVVVRGNEVLRDQQEVVIK